MIRLHSLETRQQMRRAQAARRQAGCPSDQVRRADDALAVTCGCGATVLPDPHERAHADLCCNCRASLVEQTIAARRLAAD
jgi:membrane protease subunit (stomatin/prohibitin family)